MKRKKIRTEQSRERKLDISTEAHRERNEQGYKWTKTEMECMEIKIDKDRDSQRQRFVGQVNHMYRLLLGDRLAKIDTYICLTGQMLPSLRSEA